MRIRPFFAACFLAAALQLPQSASAQSADFMFRATVDGKTIEGMPLAWNDYEMHLLGRDGVRHSFRPKDAKNARKTSPTFVGYTVPEMRNELYGEFGNSMDITTTNHYVVVHPHGRGGDWAQRFEDLYRSFLAYFRVRGFQPEEPKFPLVAVVYPDRDDYYKAAAEEGQRLPPGILGHYDPVNNRVLTYDITAGDRNADWSTNASTVIHEATHQTAFNSGIHNRFADQPKWLVEGLATMFEARGVWNSQSFHTLKDRLNEERFSTFRAKRKDRKLGTFGNLIASDKMFETDMGAAYAEAWAMTLFLCETRPKELGRYFQKLAARPDFSSYFATERVADFAGCFGNDFKQLEANFLAWMDGIK